MYGDGITDDDVIKLAECMSMTYVEWPKRSEYDSFPDWKLEVEEWLDYEEQRLSLRRSPEINNMFLNVVSGKLKINKWMKTHRNFIDKFRIDFNESCRKQLRSQSSTDCNDYNPNLYK